MLSLRVTKKGTNMKNSQKNSKHKISASNRMNLLIVLIGLVCIIEPGLAQRQRGFRQGQQCYTPENDIGQCFTLSYCPSIANVLNIYPRNDAERYLRIAQRNCGNINFRGDPVVCCGANQQYFTAPTTTNSPINQFFPTNTPPTTLPPIIIAPTPPTTPRRPETTTSAPVPSTTDGVSNRQDKSGPECQSPDNKIGICTPLAQCKSLITRLQANPNDATFVRFLKFSNTLCNNEYAVVCCLDEARELVNEGLVIPKNTNEIPRKLLTMADGCGYVNNTYRKIVGGKTSKIGAWPWIALIGYDDGISTSPFKCGGALITSRHVLTAAHCIRSDLTFVRLGEHDLNTDTETTHLDVPVVKVLKHSRYNRTDGHNDIALLYLGQNVQFTEKITPICIPFEPKIRSKSINGFTPFVAGWGRTMEGGKSSNVLQELQILIFENDLCKEKYKKQGKFISEEQFDNAVICAGDLAGGKDTCQGDSGGPLMLPEDFESSIRFHLIGVVSYGIGCARSDIPGVYSRVSNFIEWIENGIADTP